MEILTKLNWVDVLIIIIILRISYVAFQDGLSHEVFPLIGTVATTVLALHYYVNISALLSHYLGMSPNILDILSFIGLLVIIGLIFKFIRTILDKIIKVTWHPLIEKFGGLIVGIGRAFVVASVILIIISLLPLSYMQWSIKDRSVMGMYILKIGPAIYEKVSGFLPTVKIEGRPADSQTLINRIVSYKSLAAKPAKEKEKVPEWEKIYNS